MSVTLDQILGGIPGYSAVTEAMKSQSLANARIPDSLGKIPGESGYVDTYDVYFAAISLVGFLRAQPVVTQAGSEGTSVHTSAPDWDSLTAFLKQNSVIFNKFSSGILTPIEVYSDPYLARVSMDDRGHPHGDVDTDIG